MVSKEQDEFAMAIGADEQLVAQIGVDVSAELDEQPLTVWPPVERDHRPLLLWWMIVGAWLLWYLFD